MRGAEVKKLGLTFPPLKAVMFATAQDVQKGDGDGEVVCGRVVAYDPTMGAMNYERTSPVGCLVLAEPGKDHWTKIALDKPLLADAVWLAMVQAKEAGADAPHTDAWLVIRYLGDDKGYKRYRVTPALAHVGARDGLD